MCFSVFSNKNTKLLLPFFLQTVAMQAISAAGLPLAIERQAAAAVEEADALVLVVDGQTGSTAAGAWPCCGNRLFACASQTTG